MPELLDLVPEAERVVRPEPPIPLTRTTPTGATRIAFWALRAYIAVMLVLVVIGFSRGLH